MTLSQTTSQLTLSACLLLCSAAWAHDSAHQGGIHTEAKTRTLAAFDIVHTKISTEGNTAIFHMAVSGKAGHTRPTRSGQLAGSTVFSYVWPTSLDPAVAGFESQSGTLALAVTAHPDFDDTPLFDENGDGKLTNDGHVWHTHWVVLQADPACGQDALKVVDIPPGHQPKLPKTWPGLPLLIDSPGWSPSIKQHTVEVRVPFDDIGVIQAGTFDGVTAALRVSASMHNPLLCVANVFKVASGKLSLPGQINQ